MAESKPERCERLFTIDEAKAALPLVAAVMNEAVYCWEAIQAVDITFIAVTPGSKQETNASSEQSELRNSLKEQSDKFVALVNEIRDLGATVHQIEERTVHFPYMHGMELGYLCWRLGEDQIGHFHTDDERCGARRPILKS
jgi:hypothetical protein